LPEVVILAFERMTELHQAKVVIPAKAGISSGFKRIEIPAFAGMTTLRIPS
jgi:hypothetical protein